MWVLEHLHDLAADFLVFYRLEIDPDLGYFGNLTGPRFFQLAHRVSAYEGVMRLRVENEQMREQHTAPAMHGRQVVREVPATKAAVGAHADLSRASSSDGKRYPPVFEVRGGK